MVAGYHHRNDAGGPARGHGLPSLGARRVGVADDLATLADPDGNRFTLRSAD